MVFPDDDNGDVLRRMEAEGDDLTQPRDIDFTVIFSSEDLAVQFANHFRELGYAASVQFSATVETLPWDIAVLKHMAPSHKEIGDFEDQLQTVATSLGGRNDGWGCFQQKPENLPT